MPSIPGLFLLFNLATALSTSDFNMVPWLSSGGGAIFSNSFIHWWRGHCERRLYRWIFL